MTHLTVTLTPKRAKGSRGGWGVGSGEIVAICLLANGPPRHPATVWYFSADWNVKTRPDAFVDCRTELTGKSLTVITAKLASFIRTLGSIGVPHAARLQMPDGRGEPVIIKSSGLLTPTASRASKPFNSVRSTAALREARAS